MIELSDVIASLRTELDTARRAGAGQDLRFELGPVELEVSVALTKEAGADAKVKFWVVELGGSGKAASTSTQRIKLTLQPRLTLEAAQSRTELSQKPVDIAGRPVAGKKEK